MNGEPIGFSVLGIFVIDKNTILTVICLVVEINQMNTILCLDLRLSKQVSKS